MIAITVRTFEYQYVSAVRWLRCRQQRRVRCTKVTGEYNPLLFACPWISQVELNVGGTEDMAGPLETNTANEIVRVTQVEPGLVGQGNDALLNQLYITLDFFLVAADAELERIFQHDGQ